MEFRKKPVVIEATQWFQLGGHPNVGVYPETAHPVECSYCKGTLSRHGWIDTLEGGHIVCSGDWIITGVQGEHYPCKPDIFTETYERVNDE
jgi:hypothetical protein